MLSGKRLQLPKVDDYYEKNLQTFAGVDNKAAAIKFVHPHNKIYNNEKEVK
jgi:hypothetical protein